MLSGRGWVCSSRIDLPIIAASGGSAPEWLETSSAPPVAGTFSIPSTSARNQCGRRTRRASSRRSPSIRSERPQSLRRRSGSTPGRCSLSVSAGTSSAPGSRRRSRRERGVRVGFGHDGPVCQIAGGPQDRVERCAQLDPVAGGDHALALDQLLVPRVDQRGRDDAGFAGAHDVHRAVVDEHVDLELDAAGHLVERAVQVVVGQPDLRRASGRCAARRLRAPVARHVDPVARRVPVAHGLDGVLVGHAGEDVLVRVGLLDAVDHRVALERA